jgi:hypothetical protein
MKITRLIIQIDTDSVSAQSGSPMLSDEELLQSSRFPRHLYRLASSYMSVQIVMVHELVQMEGRSTGETRGVCFENETELVRQWVW